MTFAIIASVLMGPANAQLTGNPCSFCHLATEGQYMRGLHVGRGIKCRTCHGPSQGHMTAEDNSKRPDRPLDKPRRIRKRCAACHDELPAPCEAKEASCVTCHDPHSDQFEPGTRVTWTEDFESGKLDNWTFRDEDTWEIGEQDGNRYLSLKTNGAAGADPRRPATLAIMDAPKFSSFTLTCRVRNTDPLDVRGRSIVIPFCFTDVEHFYYIHFCNFSDSVHNNALIVNETDRAPMDTPNEATPVFLDENWHALKIVRDAESGLIQAYFDGELLHEVTDTTLASGHIGLGTFGSKGDYDDIRIEGIVSE